MTSRSFPAKILLFGEHTLMQGSGALVQPYHRHTATWAFGDGRQQDLLAWVEHLRNTPAAAQLRLDAFREDIERGLVLRSDVPRGYGLGSSGTLCAALIDRYGTEAIHRTDLPALRLFLGELESYFHGASSGIDPLVSYLDQTVQLDAEGQLSTLTLPPLRQFDLFLLDTGRPRQTEPLVAFVKHSWQDAAFRRRAESDWVQPTRKAIAAYGAGRENELWEAFSLLSAYQLAALPPLVIPEVRSVWENGSHSDQFRLKICGAGGGGFMLGIARKSIEIAQLAPGFRTIKLD